MHDRVGWRLLLSAIGVLAMAAGAAAEGTELHDVMKLDGGGCSVTIVPGDHQFCAGGTDSVTAVVSCSVGSVPVRSPEWFLNGSPIGSGTGIRYSAGEGVHTLSVSCGSCTDDIQVTVLPASNCAFIPNLVAAFADSNTEASTGIFQSVNVAAVTPGNFNEVKWLMRPVTLSGAPADDSGAYVLRQTGSNLQVFRTNGTQIPLPDTLHQADLPLSILVNATGLGTSTLIATYDSSLPMTGDSQPGGQQILVTSSDSVKVRVGQFPGLAGESLAMFPSFQFLRSINDSSAMKTAVDPTRHAERNGLSYRIYVVAHKTPAQWAANQTLTDVTGGFDTGTVTAGTMAANVKTVWNAPLNGGVAGTVGQPYDVVYDFGSNGVLDPGDIIDGLSYTEAGVYVMRNMTTNGSHTPVETLYSGGSWLGQDLYYPSDIGSMGEVPLVVIGHGNGHNYQWYDYLGMHLSSHGYVVMSHENQTGPGVQSAALTSVSNTEYLLNNLGTIAGGVLNGHIDTDKIIWVGHSRGGEGIVIAYDRLVDNTSVPTQYDEENIIYLRPMAPTVFFSPAAPNGPNPHDRTVELICGSADSDVDQSAGCDLCQSQRIQEATTGSNVWHQVQGAGHGNFHSCFACNPWASGPDLIGYQPTNDISKALMLAGMEWFIKGNPAAKDYLTHLWDDHRSTGVFHPGSVPPGIVGMNFKDPAASGTVIIDDYETNTTTGTSSSGGTVTFDVNNCVEGNLDEADGTYSWNPTDPFNGCNNRHGADPQAKGCTFDWTTGQQKFYEQGIVGGQQNFSAKTFLSLRMTQTTRHPETVGLNGPLYFSVELRDAAGHTSSIPTQAYGGVHRPYQRSGGWLNEWDTVRIRLADFENDNSQINLGQIVAVRLKFGSSSGSARGRVCLDQIELTNE